MTYSLEDTIKFENPKKALQFENPKKSPTLGTFFRIFKL